MDFDMNMNEMATLPESRNEQREDVAMNITLTDNIV